VSIATFIPPALADLESRAGASDKDRARWLAERQSGITATQVRDLAMGKLRQAELVDLKLGLKEDGFSGNAYTEWGNLREPFLAQVAERRGIRPESRVFHAAADSRWLASPDGVGATFDGDLIVGEYKTSGHDLTPGTPTFDRTGYREQMVWAMLVAGARRCLFVWEERLGTPETGFEAGRQFEHWIDFDEAIAKRLVTIARRFLTALDKKRADLEAGRVVAPVVDPVLDVLALDVLAGRAEETAGKTKKERAWKELQAALADREELSQRSSSAQVTWVPASSAETDTVVVDVERAQRDYAAIWDAKVAADRAWAEVLAYPEMSRIEPGVMKTAAKLTVTAVKTKEESA
jgi:hypothetical protein